MLFAGPCALFCPPGVPEQFGPAGFTAAGGRIEKAARGRGELSGASPIARGAARPAAGGRHLVVTGAMPLKAAAASRAKE